MDSGNVAMGRSPTRTMAPRHLRQYGHRPARRSSRSVDRPRAAAGTAPVSVGLWAPCPCVALVPAGASTATSGSTHRRWARVGTRSSLYGRPHRHPVRDSSYFPGSNATEFGSRPSEALHHPGNWAGPFARHQCWRPGVVLSAIMQLTEHRSVLNEMGYFQSRRARVSPATLFREGQ